MGRIEHGLDALRLICAKSTKSADELARLLSKTNTKRQDLTTSAITQAQDLVIKEHLVGVVSHKSWHEGVIGLVASRLVETHHKPMVVISRRETVSKDKSKYSLELCFESKGPCNSLAEAYDAVLHNY